MSRINRHEVSIIRKAHAMVRSGERVSANVIASREASKRIASELPDCEWFSKRDMDSIHIIARQALWDAAKNSDISINWEK
jgi:hypothetical protein